MRFFRSILILSLCLGFVGAVLAQEARWMELNVQALKLLQQGNHGEAAKVLTQAVEVAEKTFGPSHPNVATSLYALAWQYQLQEKYSEAESLNKRSLAILEKTRGPDHPDVATSLNSLAELYRKMGKEEEASKLEERAKKIKSRSGTR